MRNAYDIFDFYRDSVVLSEDDYADFLVIVQDTAIPADGAMAVSGLTLALLERDWSKEKLLLLMKAFHLGSAEIVRERIIVGFILLLMKYNTIIRENTDLLDGIQDILTEEPELSFTALCNIARTSQVKNLEKFNQQMAKDIMPLMNQVGSDEFYDVIPNSSERELQIGFFRGLMNRRSICLKMNENNCKICSTCGPCAIAINMRC